MRVTVNIADVTIEIEDLDSKPTVDGIETLLNRAIGSALNAYAGLVDIDAIAGIEADEDEEESVTPDDE